MNIQELKGYIISQIVSKVNNLFGEEPESVALGFPPDVSFGDFTFGCFALAKRFSKKPAEIASQIASQFNQDTIIEKAQAVGPYVNFKVFNNVLFKIVCNDLIDNGVVAKSDTSLHIMVEYLSPNTNKPLHLGHLRNGALGMAISNMFEATGSRVVKANLINDRGVHICKSMLAWQRWGDGQTPESAGLKGDHFVGKWYVRYAKEEEGNVHLTEEVQEMLQRWEMGDPEVIALWKRMNKWVYEGFAQTYAKFGLKFDTMYYESDTYKLGKDIVEKGLRERAFTRTGDGAVVAVLPTNEFNVDKEGNPKKVTVLRADGTSVYMTQDLGTAVSKFEEHNLERSIYVVGSEQDYHFKCLFKLLGMLGFPWASECYHLSYGMVYLPEGKMKSREGKIVDADDLIKKVEELAAIEISRRDAEKALLEEEIKARATKIAVGAIKFYLLMVGPQKDIHFDPVASISFDGCTGPYCQYAYARAKRLVQAEKIDKDELIDFGLLGEEEELLLVQRLLQLPNELLMAVDEMNPSRLVSQVHSLAMAFNQFYQKIPVIKAEDQGLTNARLALVGATSVALKQSLNLLGIEVLEEM